MTTYSVTRISDQAEVYRYSAGTPIPWSGMEFDTHDHTEVVEVVPDVQPVTVTARIWSRVDFLRKFTPAERIAIRTAAKQVPELDDFMFLLEAAAEVHSDNPDVVAGLTLLTQVGLLAVGRAGEILA